MLVKEAVEALLEQDQEAHLVMDDHVPTQLEHIKAIGELAPTERQRFCGTDDDREVVVLSRFSNV